MTRRDVDYCPTCGDTHNPWMSCTTARRLRTRARPGWCERCEHEHHESLGGICIGCACSWRPPVPAEPAEPVRSLGDCDLRTLPLFGAS